MPGEDEKRGILCSFLRADGAGAVHLNRPAGGTRNPYRTGVTQETDFYLKMAGKEVYNFAVRVIVESIERLLQLSGCKIDDIAYIVPHQANVRIIHAAARRMKIPFEKFYLNIQEYANTSAASIPIALTEMQAKECLKPGDVILTVGFGGGLTYGGNVIRW
jgi:3-oxoacyl-[acyl-carrier-protein] synthase-3